MTNILRRLTPLRWFLILALITIGLALGLPPDPHAVQQLHTSAAIYRLAVAVVLIPYLLIWYLSFYAWAKLRDYAGPLKHTKDGAGFQKIAQGMGLLAFSLILPTTISLVLTNLAVHQPQLKPAAVILNNYLGLIPGMLAFLIILNGSRRLLRLIPDAMEKFDLRWHAPWFLLLSVVFSHLVIENHYQHHPYHLPLWLLITTFIVPFLYGWTVGFLSAYALTAYAKTVRGLLYQRAIKQFARGITIVISGSIAIQFVNVTLGQRINSSLGAVLLVDYVLLMLMAAGLLFMALGTKKLKKIEEA